MDYPELRLEVLEIFAEAQHEATNRRAAQEHQKWGWFWRAGRFGFPVGKTELGRLPALVTCLHCGRGITSNDPRVVRSHVQKCLSLRKSPANPGLPERHHPPDETPRHG